MYIFETKTDVSPSIRTPPPRPRASTEVLLGG